MVKVAADAMAQNFPQKVFAHFDFVALRRKHEAGFQGKAVN